MNDASFRSPDSECDLVMKGGVTSGIVYPPAILQLAKKYRFRSIGGTSAGAIAAAMTAAAEYGRTADGFHTLRAVTDELAAPGSLLGLFRAQPSTRPLFDLLLSFLALPATGSQSRAAFSRGALSALASFGRLAARASVPRVGLGGTAGLVAGALIGVAITLAFAAASAATGLRAPFGVLWRFALLIGLPLAWISWWLGRRVGAAYTLFEVATKAVPENAYGICNGMSDANGPESLTPWMHRTINSLAGLSEGDDPLTFEKLQSRSDGPSITLRMITSNLSHNRPYELPLKQRIWIARAEEFGRLFPPRVMQYLQDRAYQSTATILPDGYFYLPEGDTLPVVVAARMSLSFPFLVSAVPLYTVKRSAFVKSRRDERNVVTVTPRDLQRSWFSDGGICSNFPIHFFDTWLPQRPTFGIKLTAFPDRAFTTNEQLDRDYLGELHEQDSAEGAAASKTEDDVDPIYLSPANRAPTPEWQPIGNDDGGDADADPNLWRFLRNIFTTAQNHRDNMQSDLPSYRERIVQIRLRETEGGLNLAMSRETIANVMAKGTSAGDCLLRRFSLMEHQWVRLLTVASRIEDAAEDIDRSVRNGTFSPGRLLLAQRTGGFPYPRARPSWVRGTLKRLRSAESFVEEWSGRHFRNRPPEPEPTLQVTPRL